jgi:hypothetical protein
VYMNIGFMKLHNFNLIELLALGLVLVTEQIGSGPFYFLMLGNLKYLMAPLVIDSAPVIQFNINQIF